MPSRFAEIPNFHKPLFAPVAEGQGGDITITKDLPLSGKRTVITGTSRGIGQKTAIEFAAAGSDIIGNHLDPKKGRRQGETAKAVLENGVEFESIVADITDPEGRKALLEGAIGDLNNPKKIDILILNAAGGLEDDKPEDWAERFNIQSQNELIDAFLPHMNPGGAIVFPTSLWAHRYGEIVQFPTYGAVARSKHIFEQQFRDRQQELADRGINAHVVVGHVITDTSAHTLFSRYARDVLKRLEPLADGGKFPDAGQMGNAIKDVVLENPEQTVYVGGTGAEYIEPLTEPLDRVAVHKKLRMYSPSKLLVDTFELTKPEVGHGSYTVKRRDTAGHFTSRYDKRFAGIDLYRGQDQGEEMAQVFGLTLLQTEGDSGGIAVFGGTDGVRYKGMVFTGNKTEVDVRITRRTKDAVIGTAQMRVGDDIVSEADRIELKVIPNETIGKRLVAQAKAARENS